jgi:hypothetical protein
LVLEEIVENQTIEAPTCLSGAPEDSGGPIAYREFLNEPTTTGRFDPERFVLIESDAAVATAVVLDVGSLRTETICGSCQSGAI